MTQPDTFTADDFRTPNVREIVARRGWPVTVRSLPAVLHNRPQKITILAERGDPAFLASVSASRAI